MTRAHTVLHKSVSLTFAVVLLFGVSIASTVGGQEERAQEKDETQVKQLEARIAVLEERVAELESLLRQLPLVLRQGRPFQKTLGYTALHHQASVDNLTENLLENEKKVLQKSDGGFRIPTSGGDWATTSERKQVWAAPLVFGPWVVVGSHAGEVRFKFEVEPIADTEIFGEVRYFKAKGKRVTEIFRKEVTIRTGDVYGNVEVRLKGVPTGASCWVTVE